MKKILFVCTGNSCRSVLAEAVFRDLCGREGLECQAYSAGTMPRSGGKASPQTAEYLKKEGLNCALHRTQKITRPMIEETDLLLVMERKHREHILKIAPEAAGKTLLLSEFYPEEGLLTGPDIPDPIGMSDFFHENVNEIVKACCHELAARLKEEQQTGWLNFPRLPGKNSLLTRP